MHGAMWVNFLSSLPRLLFGRVPAGVGRLASLLALPATPQPILSKLSSACAEAAKYDLYATTAKRAGQPDDYYADAEPFRQRLARDIESKARVLSRLKTQ
jgi:hypothetical protein